MNWWTAIPEWLEYFFEALLDWETWALSWADFTDGLLDFALVPFNAVLDEFGNFNLSGISPLFELLNIFIPVADSIALVVVFVELYILIQVVKFIIKIIPTVG